MNLNLKDPKVAYRVWISVAVIFMVFSVGWTCFVLQTNVSPFHRSLNVGTTAFCLTAVGGSIVLNLLASRNRQRHQRKWEERLAKIEEIRQRTEQRIRDIRGPRDARALWEEMQADYPPFRDAAMEYARKEAALILACLDRFGLQARFTIPRAHDALNQTLTHVVTAFAAIDLPSANVASIILKLSSPVMHRVGFDPISLPEDVRKWAVQIVQAKLALQLKLLELAAVGNQLMDLMSAKQPSFERSMRSVDEEEKARDDGRAQFEQLLPLIDEYQALAGRWEDLKGRVNTHTAEQLDIIIAMPFVEPLNQMLRQDD